MSDPSKPKLLESLRAQSSAVRAQGEAARKPVEEALGDIDRLLWRAFRWLDEALGHLEVIQPVVGHRFQLPNVGAIDRPRYERGFVATVVARWPAWSCSTTSRSSTGWSAPSRSSCASIPAARR